MNKLSFEWDEANMQHVTLDHPERDNTIEEVESLFADPSFITEFDREDPRTGELRYWGMGIGTQGILKYVVYVIRKGKIRPITCHTAKRNQRIRYYERASESSSQSGESSSENEASD